MSDRQAPAPLPPPPPGSGTAQRPGSPGALPAAALGVAVVVIVAAGVVGVAMSMGGASHTMMWGGPRVAAPGAVGPAFTLAGLPGDVVEHYAFARANADVYAQVPCFCGCQEMLGHRDLARCFVTPDGAWESHAAGCQVCIDESRMLMGMMGRGMGPGMMRDRIVSEFGGPMMGG